MATIGNSASSLCGSFFASYTALRTPHFHSAAASAAAEIRITIKIIIAL